MSPEELVASQFELLETLGVGSRSTVYQVQTDSGPAALKLHVSSDGSAGQSARKEAAWLTCVRHRLLPEVWEVGDLGGGEASYVLMEQLAGDKLSWHLQEHGALSEAKLLQLARELADTLRHVHPHGLVHQDLNPDNIILSPAGEARVVDFGIASGPQGEHPKPLQLSHRGYCAPEQSGYLIRPVDGRTDLFALGVVLYQSLSLKLPFGPDGRQWQDQARRPSVREHRPEISPVLDAIIARLLALDPDDRYGSASELLYDLDRLEALAQEHRDHGVLVLGHPHPALLREELPLVGRESELSALLQAWREVQDQQQGQMLLLEGPPGGGKSRLIRAFLRKSAPPYHAMGKCNQESATRLFALHRALSDWMGQLTRLPEARRGEVEAALREQFSSYGALLWQALPALRPLLPEASEVSQEASNHIHTAVASALCAIATQSGGWVLFLDDVQWSDGMTLEVLRLLGHRLQDAPILLLVASRNDPDSQPGLQRFLKACQPRLAGHIALLPFRDEEIRQATRDILHLPLADERLLCFLQEKSQGNPFALHQSLYAVLNAGCLTPHRGQWRVDAEALQELGLPDDVVQIVLFRMGQQSEQSNQVLQWAAVLGYSFSMELLQEATGLSQEALAGALSEALSHQLLEGKEQGYSFIHDRVHEAFLRSMGEQQRRGHHEKLAQLLYARLEGQPELLASCAEHSLQSGADDRRSHELCLRAGMAAKTQFAQSQALVFLERALDLGRKLELPPTYELCFALGVVCMRKEQVNRAHEYFNQAMELASNDIERAWTHNMLGEVHLAHFRLVAAEESLLQSLECLGQSEPSSSFGSMLMGGLLWLLAYLRYSTFAGLLERPPMSPQREEATSALQYNYNLLSRTYYFQLRDLEMLQVWLRQYRLALRHGSHQMLALVYGSTCAMVGQLQWPQGVLHFREASLSLAGKDPHLIAMAEIFGCWGLEFTGRVPEVTSRTWEALEAHGEWLEPFEWVNGHNGLIWALMARGQFEAVEALAKRALQKIELDESAESHLPMSTTLGGWAVALNGLGRRAEAQHCIARAHASTRSDVKERHTRSFTLASDIWMHFERDDFGDSFEALCQELYAMELAAWRVPIYVKYIFAFEAVARLHQCQKLPPAQRSQALPRLKASLRQLKQIAFLPVFRPYLLYVQGGLARLEGDAKRAQSFFERAHKEALRWEHSLLLCELLCQQARMAVERGQTRAAKDLALQALSLCDAHGWVLREGRLQQEFCDLLPDATPQAEDAAFAIESFSRQLQALLQISLASASHTTPEALSRTVLDELTRLLGAERAFLFAHQADHSLQRLAARDAQQRDLSDDAQPHTPTLEFVLERRQSVVLGGSHATRQEGLSLEDSPHGIRSVIATPLQMRDQIMGILYLDNRWVGGLFDRGHITLLQALANHVAVALFTTQTTQLLSNARDHAMKADQAKSLFLATMGHELRTPLNAILGYTELLLEEPFDDPEMLQEDLQKIRQSGHQLLEIISSILEYTDLESRQFQPQVSAFFLHDFTAQLVESLSMYTAGSGAPRFVLEQPEKDHLVHSDRQACFRILQPILRNAFQLTEQGEVALEVRWAPEELRFCIRDTGPGLDEEALQKIFRPLYQVDMSHTRLHAGVGMGLTLSQRLCQGMGGQIEVESTLGEGTTFRVALPQILSASDDEAPPP